MVQKSRNQYPDFSNWRKRLSKPEGHEVTEEVVFAEVPFVATAPETRESELIIKYRDFEIILHTEDSIPLAVSFLSKLLAVC